MSFLRAFLPAFFVALALSGNAVAASTYLLQLGYAPTREEADALYKDVMEHHEDVLKDYGYIAKESKRAAPEKRVRVQIGPVTSRKIANSICADLRAQDTPCFVVETVSKEQAPTPVAKKETVVKETPTPAPEVKSEGSFWNIFGSSTEKNEAVATPPQKIEPETPPVQAKKAPAPVEQKIAAAEEPRININTTSVRTIEEPPVPEIDLFGSISSMFSSKESKEEAPQVAAVATPSLAPAANTPIRQGRVEVAEAIPVPLSDDVRSETPLPKMKMVDEGRKPEEIAAKIARNQKLRAGKVLQIGTFTDGPSAMSCWDQLASAEPAAKKLKAKAITGTSGSIGLPRATLRIEPINEELKSRICDLVSTCGEDISCRTPGKEVTESPLAPVINAVAPSEPLPLGGYWVQLGAFPSYAHAQSRFEELKETQSDIVGAYEAVIRAPVNARAKTYRLRVGPFESQNEADKMCWKLAAKGVDCVSISE